jgi:hypothetical protein
MDQAGRGPFPGGEDCESPGGFGCPMLVRGHAVVPAGHRPLVRCSLGWAIRGEQEIARCVATETSLRCWKAREDHGALHEAAFVASRAPKRRVASALAEPTDTGSDTVAGDTAPSARPDRERRGPRQPSGPHREHVPVDVPPLDEPERVAADH